MEGATAPAALARRRDWGTALFAACALAVAVVGWPLKSVAPAVGGDWEWVATLSYGAEHGMRFGSQLVWTYGPLGFLETPYGATLYYPDTLALSWLYQALLQLLLAATLLAGLRRAFPLPVAALLAAAMLPLLVELGPGLGFAWCVLLVVRAGADRAPPIAVKLPAVALPLALGALTGVVVLDKLNQGVELLALGIVALVVTARRRDAIPFAAALLGTATIGWAATGQRLADVWPYVRNGLEPISGYAAAMGESDPRPWLLPLGFGLTALAVALAWDVGRGLPRRTRLGLVLLCLIFGAFNFKEGFVRQDGLHMLIFFGDLLVLYAVLLGRARRRLVLLAGMAAGVVAYGAIMGGQQTVTALNPYNNARAVADEVATLASPAREDRLLADARMRIAGFYQFAPRLAAAVGRRRVMLWPFAYGDLAYAFGLRLQPLVALEPYGAYTPRLDRLGAQVLASGGAPPRILRTSPAAAPALGGRYATFEAPLATLQIFCRYREVAREGAWQVLVRVPDRCGAPRVLGTETARWGAPVAVPAPRRPGALVLARIEGAGAHGLERLRELLLKPEHRWVSLDGARFRLIAATASEGLLIGAPRGADYRPPFAMAPNPQQIAVGRDGGEPGGTLRYTFLELAVRR